MQFACPPILKSPQRQLFFSPFFCLKLQLSGVPHFWIFTFISGALDGFHTVSASFRRSKFCLVWSPAIEKKSRCLNGRSSKLLYLFQWALIGKWPGINCFRPQTPSPTVWFLPGFQFKLEVTTDLTRDCWEVELVILNICYYFRCPFHCSCSDTRIKGNYRKYCKFIVLL